MERRWSTANDGKDTKHESSFRASILYWRFTFDSLQCKLKLTADKSFNLTFDEASKYLPMKKKTLLPGVRVLTSLLMRPNLQANV